VARMREVRSKKKCKGKLGFCEFVPINEVCKFQKLMKQKLLMCEVIQWEGLEGPDAFIIRVHGCKTIEIRKLHSALQLRSCRSFRYIYA